MQKSTYNKVDATTATSNFDNLGEISNYERQKVAKAR
jgi:hypothetical protein